MLSVEDRATAVLAAVGEEADTQAASGRYRRSRPIRPGVRYWSTARLRQREDVFGVQFHGAGLVEAKRLRAAFERAHFEVRNPESSKITYARPIPFGEDEQVDSKAIFEAKRAVDVILGAQPDSRKRSMTFLEFMQASPWADTEIDLPERLIDPPRPTGL